MVAFARFATRVALGAVSLALSRALLEVAHLYGWYPERQLAQLVTGVITTEAALWAIVAVIALAIWAGLDFVFYRRNPLRRWPQQTSSIDLSVGDTQPFFATKTTDSHIRRTHNLKIENIGSTALSECNVAIIDIAPPQNVYAPPWQLRAGQRLPLNAGESLFLPFATYGEAYASGCIGDTFFGFETKGHAPLPDATKEHTVTVRASARQPI